MDPSDDVTQVAQTYTPHAFDVTRGSSEFNMSTTSTVPGTDVTLSSVDPCHGTEVHGSFINEQAVSNFMVLPDANGNWSATVPTASTDDMSGETTNFPVGSYEVSAFCQTSSGLATTFYGEQVLTVTNTSTSQPNYVAMGDSYSSGEGVEPFEAGTYGQGSNMCHRSTQAYARILEDDSSLNLNLGSNGFVACSGATTNAITHSYNGEYPQLSKITADTKLITMTLGGNDMQFANYAKQCIAYDCSGTDSAAAVRRIVNNVIPNMNTTLNKIHARLNALGNTNATVLVVGYPQLLPTHTFNTVIAGCSWLDGGRELQAIRNTTTLLNTAIKNEANAVGPHFHFVSATESNSPFAGHEICQIGNTWYFHNVVALPLDKQVYTFHPNALGQQAYATLIKNYLTMHHLTN
jgi:lysophospholipase L1-like esterase